MNRLRVVWYEATPGQVSGRIERYCPYGHVQCIGAIACTVGDWQLLGAAFERAGVEVVDAKAVSVG